MSNEHEGYYRGLEIMTDVCVGCSHCMKVCPTEALRVSGGKATLHVEWCIECGNCYMECPSRAIRVIDDDFEKIFNYEHRLLLIPSLFYAQFENRMDIDTINSIIGSLGFTEVCPVEQGVDYLIEEINKFIDNAEEKPVISSFCPAVVRLIQVMFPSLVDNIVNLLPPLEITAQYHRRKYLEAGVGEEKIGIFYLTPCVSKIAAIKAPVGGYVSPVNGVINMDLLYSKVMLAYKQKKFGDGSIKTQNNLTANGIRWSTTRGEANAVKGVALAIDGISHVRQFLEKVENGDVEGVDYLELRACDESCAGGILVRSNRFLIADDLNNKAAFAQNLNPDIEDFRKYCDEFMHFEKVQPRNIRKYGIDINEAIKKMEEVRILKKELPGIDCGSCGAPSCEALAEDIVSGERDINHCIFKQIKNEKEGKLSSGSAIEIMEKIWGKKYDS